MESLGDNGTLASFVPFPDEGTVSVEPEVGFEATGVGEAGVAGVGEAGVMGTGDMGESGEAKCCDCLLRLL